jgi:hypothetical protein
MVDKHSQSFFGKSSGLTIQSSSKNDSFIFLQCIQKKSDGSWEKPSNGEGKNIKINMDEMVMILEVLNKNLQNWSSYHKFNEANTQISFKWDDAKKHRLYINIGKYSKMLNYAQTEILRLLLKHLLKEKIEYATSWNLSKNKLEKRPREKSRISIELIKSDKQNGQTIPIEGAIKGETQKALLINFDDEYKLWIPKSAISIGYNPEIDMAQTFHIASWLLRKNNLIT